MEWREMTQSCSGKRTGDVIWPQALVELAMASKVVIVILDGRSWSRKCQWILLTHHTGQCTTRILCQILRTLFRLMEIPGVSIVRKGEQSWGGVETVTFKPWLRKQEVFSLEVGRLRGALTTVAEYLLWMGKKICVGVTIEPVDRGFNGIYLNSI